MYFQKDEVANVVRVFDGDELVAELDPAAAETLGEELLRSAEDLRAYQSTLGGEPDDDQLTLTEGSEESGGLAEEVRETADDDWDLGDVHNPHNPLDY